MDPGGRVVIPAPARAALGLRPGQEFTVRVIDGGLIEFEPVEPEVRLVIDDGGLPVLVTDGSVEPLTDDEVRAAIDADRDDRSKRWV